MVPAGVDARAGAGASPARYLLGSALNRSRQRAEQKYQLRPACSAVCVAPIGSTVMPHTGSLARSCAGGTGCAPAWWCAPVTSAFMIDLLARLVGAARFRLDPIYPMGVSSKDG